MNEEYIYNVSLSKRRTTTNLLKEKYELIKELGSGGFGKVYLATLSGTNHIFAIKIVSTKTLEQQKTVKQEIDLLNAIDSPYIMKIIEHFPVKDK